MAKSENHAAPSVAFRKYRSTFYERRSDLSADGLRKTARAHVRDFAAWLPADKNAPILDVGCGGGAFVVACRELGYTRVRGIDISEEQIEHCRQQGIEGVECADASAYLAESREHYELVVLLDVLEHQTKERAFALLDHVNERLVPAGRVLLRVPNMSNPLNLRTRYVDATHEIGFSRESLDQVLRLTGFEPELIDAATGPHPNPLMRLVFDVVLWKLFLVFYRRTMRLKDDPLPAKNLVAIGRKAAPAAAGS